MAKPRAELHVSTVKDEGPTKSTERVDELGDHATKTNIRLRAMGAGAKKAGKDLLKLASSATVAGLALKTVTKQSDMFHRVMFKGTKMMQAMGGMLAKTLTGGLKLATVSIGAMGLALVGIHALFVAGRFLVKSYHVALQGLAATAAGATVAMGLLSAAMREQQAATYAYTGKNNKEFGSGLNQVRVNMRGLAHDTELAGAGAAALNKVYAEIAKGKSGYMGGSKTLLKDLGDFASAGQPLEEGLLKAAKVVNAIQDPKTGIGGIQAAFKEMGPAAEEALKKAKKEGINTKKEFIEAMKSGKLSALGGVTGQMEAVNGTLMGQFKKYFNLIKAQFGDFGQQFLPQAKVALERIYRIINKTLSQTSGAVAGWEKSGGFVDMLVKGVQKVSDFYVRLIRDYLPKSQGMFDRLGSWWGNFKEGWSKIVRDLKPFIEGARVFEKMFGNAWRPIWEQISSSSREFNTLTQKNRVEFMKLGTTIGQTVAEILKVIQIFQNVIQENLPFINNMIRGLKVIVEQFTRVFGFLKGLPGMGSQGAMALMLAMARGMKTARGTVVNDKMLTKQMNVQASSVKILSSAIAGGTKGFFAKPTLATTGPGGGGAAGALGLGPSASSAATATTALASSARAAASALRGVASVGRPGLASSTGGTPRYTPATVPAHLLARSAAARAAATAGGVPVMAGAAGAAGTRLTMMQRLRAAKANAMVTAGRTAAIYKNNLPTTAGVGSKMSPGGRHFSALSKMQGSAMAYSNQRAADKDAKGSKYKMDGMVGGFILQQGLSKLSNKVGDEDIKGGLGLASSMALFSPKLALGIAGGTFAAKSSNMALAAGGGALAGAQIGKSFGPMGQAIGIAIGGMTGVIMAPLNALKAKRKEAKAMVDDFFKDTFGNFMVNMATTEAAARAKGGTETTLIKSMENETARIENLAAIGKRGKERGGKKTGRLSLMEEMLRGGVAGGTTGAAIGLGVGIVTAAPTGGISIPAATAIGAGIGTAVGVTLGLGKFAYNKVADMFGASDEQKEDRKIKRQSLNEIYAAGGMSDTQFEKLTGKRKRKFARDEEMDDDLVAAYFKEFAEKTEAMAAAQKTATTTVDKRVKEIEKITGKTSMEIIMDAQRLGVNLADPYADFNEQLEKLGATVIQTSKQIDQAIATIMSNAISNRFDQAIKQEQAPLILDEAIKNFRQDYDQSPGSVSAEQTRTILGTYTEQLTNAYGGDSSKAYFETMRQVGTPNGLAFRDINPVTGKKNPLGGLGKQVYEGKGGDAARAALGDMESQVAGVGMQQLGAILARSGFSLGEEGLKNAKTSFMNMGVDEQEAFINKISGMSPEKAAGLGKGGATDLIGMLGVADTLEVIDKMSAAFMIAESNEEKSAALLMAEREVVEGMAKFFGPNSENPEWWTKDALRDLFIQAGIIKDEDTSTPRGKGIGDTTSSRLSKTLERHSAMNNTISGKRTITSAFRTNNLGSINSDHLTGRAFDLTGNQLGMYKTTVERQGGFAEFHGGSQNRHLHVVPGPEGPAGDAANPYSPAPQRAMSSSLAQGNGAITMNLNVNGIGIKEAIPQIKAEIERSLYEYSNRT